MDKSLLQLETGDPPRYRLLESTRLYAAERLRDDGGSEAVDARHVAAMREVADQVEAGYWVMPDTQWLARHAGDYDDLQVAFERACALPDPTAAAAMVEALFRLDHLRAVQTSMNARMEAVRHLIPRAVGEARARLWSGFTRYRVVSNRWVEKLNASREAAAGWRDVGNPRRLFEALTTLAANCAAAGEFGLAELALQEADLLERPDWPARLRWAGEFHRSHVAAHRGDADAYLRHLEGELTFAERAGSPCQTANARLGLADASLMAGRVDQAICLARASVDELKRLNLPGMLSTALINLTAALVRQGQFDAACGVAPEAIVIAWQQDDSGALCCHLASLAAARQCDQAALQLLGFARSRYAEQQFSIEPNEAWSCARAAEWAEARVGAARAAHQLGVGAALDAAAARAVAEDMLDDAGIAGASTIAA